MRGQWGKFLVSIIIFTGILLGQGKVLHTPPRNVQANNPLKIEALIEGNVVEPERIRLFYRIAGQNSFVEEEMSEYMGVYFAEIPADFVTENGIEYLITCDLADGNILAFPEVNPYNVPMFVAVRKAPQAATKPARSALDVVGGIHSDVIVLSPEEGEIITPAEVVLAFSLFNTADVDLSSIQLTLDGKSLMGIAEITEDLIIARPRNLIPGAHVAKLNMSNRYGDRYATLSINFQVVKTVQETQHVLKSSGRLAAETNSEQNSGIRQVTNTLRGNFSTSYDWLNFRAKLLLTSRESPDRQPRNRFFAGIKTPVLDIAVGDVNPQFSDLALQGKRIRGFEANVKLRYFNTHIVYGKSERAIQGSIGAPDTLGDGSFEYTRSGYTYSRNLLAVRPYFGSGQHFQFGLSFLKARDDTLSVKKEAGGIVESDGNSIVMGGFNKPQDNIVIGTDLTLALDSKRFVWKTDGAFSMLNRDITGGALTLDELDTFLPGDTLKDQTVTLGDQSFPLTGIPDPGDFDHIFIINENIDPLIPIVPNADGGIGLKEALNMPSTAFKTALKMNYFNNYLVLKYQRVGAQFASLGNNFLRTDVQGFNVSDKIRLLGSKMFLTITYDQKRDNLSKSKRATTTTSSLNAGISLYPGEGLPTINFNTISYGRENDLDIFDIDTVVTVTDTSTTTKYDDPRESNLTSNQNIRISHVVEFSGLKNTLNFTFANSGRNDRIDNRNDTYQFNQTKTSVYTFGINTTYSFPLRTSINFTSNTSKSSLIENPYELLMFSARARYEFFGGRLMTELGYTKSEGSGMVDFSTDNIYTGGTFRFFERHQIRWRFQNRHQDNRLKGVIYNDFSFLLNYTILL